MFRKILVPLDFTEENEAALKAAGELAGREGTELTLLHVIETLRDVSFEEMRDFYERLEKRAARKLGEAAAGLAGAAASAVRQDVVYGQRAEQIVAYAAERGMDLILLSSHKPGAKPSSPLGAISHRVAVFASCPVLLVK